MATLKLIKAFSKAVQAGVKAAFKSTDSRVVENRFFVQGILVVCHHCQQNEFLLNDPAPAGHGHNLRCINCGLILNFYHYPERLPNNIKLSRLQINNQSLPTRCEICHQNDCFDAQTGFCSRCSNRS